MYASVTTVQFRPDKVDEVVSAFRDMVPAFAPRATGLREALVVADRATGKLMTISFWDTEANRNASEGLWQEANARVAPFAMTAPARQGYGIVDKVEV